MIHGAIGRRLRRIAGALVLGGLAAGCAGTSQGPTAYAPADFGKDDASRAERLVRYCDRLAGEGKLITALGLCARAHELNPEDADTMMRIAGLLQAMDRDDAAAQTYTALLARHPGHHEALYSLGKVYMESGEAMMAAVQFNRAVEKKPEDPRPYNALGIIRDQAGEHQAAQALYRSALERDPYYLSARNNLGLSLALNGNRDEAIDVLAEAAVEPGADETVLHNLEAAYAATTAALPIDNGAPSGPMAPEGAPQGIDRPVKPVVIKPPQNDGLPEEGPGSSPGDVPQAHDNPIPLMMPKTAGEPEQSGALQPDDLGEAAGIEEVDGALSVIAAAVTRLLEPPEWADFEPGELLAALPPAVPVAVPAQVPVLDSEAPLDTPATLAPMQIEVFDEDLSSVERPARVDPYYLSMLIVNDAGSNV
ncbi:tetratricopeptide repeat protein [Pelagibius litoralis]|uniref:Tetratricopeptide repeat protein n=1 Tax=Pelagibius litoralis TaxID=374515 RepID=A0A967C4H0_9PROT|nr:tetratricopeptide repeat protein [Pelagibius litoralis]NIA67091.1 tetratricopeptide repeat protein [Pelagibius litoralis]